MGRKESIIRFINTLVAEADAKGYEHWARQDFPIAYECVFENWETQVEIQALEIEPEYVHLLISASNSPLGFWFTKNQSIIVRATSSPDCDNA